MQCDNGARHRPNIRPGYSSATSSSRFPNGSRTWQRSHPSTEPSHDTSYPAHSRATIPDDFQQALDANPSAKAFFETLTGSTRYAFLYRLHNVKRADARARRIADYIERLSQHRTLHDR